MISEPKFKAIPVGELKLGMYIAELDRPWLETPFKVQGFLLERIDDLMLLQKYCEHVTIVQETSDRGVSVGKGVEDLYVEDPVPFEQAVDDATEDYKIAQQTARSMMEEAKSSDRLFYNKAEYVIDRCVNHILKNKDVLIWLSKIYTKNEHLMRHSLNVGILAINFGRFLKLNADELKLLGLAGMMHDIGMMEMETQILQKQEPLTEEDMMRIREHPKLSREILERDPSISPVVSEAAYHHHEYWNGDGYPRGIKSTDIPLYARIIAICDSYDAITSKQVYHEARTSREALQILYANRGGKYDPDLTLKFIQSVGMYPVGSLVELVNGMVGFVIDANPSNKRLPTVVIALDGDKKPQDPLILELKSMDTEKLERGFHVKQILNDGDYGLELQQFYEDHDFADLERIS